MYIYIYTVTDGGMVRSVAPVFIFVCNKKKRIRMLLLDGLRCENVLFACLIW